MLQSQVVDQKGIIIYMYKFTITPCYHLGVVCELMHKTQCQTCITITIIYSTRQKKVDIHVLLKTTPLQR